MRSKLNLQRVKVTALASVVSLLAGAVTVAGGNVAAATDNPARTENYNLWAVSKWESAYSASKYLQQAPDGANNTVWQPDQLPDMVPDSVKITTPGEVAVSQPDGSVKYLQDWKIVFNDKGVRGTSPYRSVGYGSPIYGTRRIEPGRSSNPKFLYSISPDLEIVGNVTYTMTPPEGKYEGNGFDTSQSTALPPWTTSGSEHKLTFGIDLADKEGLNDFKTGTPVQCIAGRQCDYYGLETISNSEGYEYRFQKDTDQAKVDKVLKSIYNQTDSKVQGFNYHTQSIEDERYPSRDLATTVTFTTERDPMKTLTQDKSYVLAGYKTYDNIADENKYHGFFSNRVQTVYVDYTIDSDKDGLSDRNEVMVYGTDPNNADTDGDGVNDGVELNNPEDPTTHVLNPVYTKTVGNDTYYGFKGTGDPGLSANQGSLALPKTLNKGDLISGNLTKVFGVQPESGKELTNKRYTLVLRDKDGKILAQKLSNTDGSFDLVVGEQPKRNSEKNVYDNTYPLDSIGQPVVTLEPVSGFQPVTDSKQQGIKLEVWQDGFDDRFILYDTPAATFENIEPQVVDNKNSAYTTLTPETATKKPATSLAAVTADNVVPVTVTLKATNGQPMTGAAQFLRLKPRSETSKATFITQKDGGYQEISGAPQFVETSPGVYQTAVTVVDNSGSPVTENFDLVYNYSQTKTGHVAEPEEDRLLTGNGTGLQVVKYVWSQGDPTVLKYALSWSAKPFDTSDAANVYARGETVSSTQFRLGMEDQKTFAPVDTPYWITYTGLNCADSDKPAGAELVMLTDGTQECRIAKKVTKQYMGETGDIKVPNTISSDDPYVYVKVYGAADAVEPLSAYPKLASGPLNGGVVKFKVSDPVTLTATITNTPASTESGTAVSGVKVTGQVGEDPAKGKTVYVKVPGETDLRSVALNGSGEATLADFTPTTDDKTITVYSDAGGKNQLATAELTVTAPAKAKTATPYITKAEVGKDGTLTVEGTVDAAEGTTVTVTLPGSQTLTGTVDSNGKFTASGTPTTALTSASQIKVTAQETGKTVSDAKSTTLEFVKQDAPTNLTAVRGEDGTTTITGDSTAPDGTPVTIILPGNTTLTGVVKNGKLVQDADGTPLTTTKLAVGKTIKATVGTPDQVSPEATTTVKASAVPTSVAYDNLPTSAIAGSEVSGITAIVKDLDGNPVASGTKVAVTVPGKTDPQIVTVGNNGEVTIPNFTPTKSGDNTITIAATDAAGTGAGAALIDGTKTISVKAGAVDASKSTYEVKNGASGSVAGSGLGQVEIVLKDAYGNTITDDLTDSLVLPTFDGGQPQAVERNGKKISFSTQKYAYTILYSSTKAGTFPYLPKVKIATANQPIVNLVTGGAEGDTPVTTSVNPSDNTTWGALKWIPGTPAKVTAWSGEPATYTAGTEVSGVKATVTDANGNPVASGTKVAVTVPGKTDPQIVTVGNNGEVTIPNFTPTKSGDNTITIAATDAAGTGAGAALTDGTKTISVKAGAVDASKSSYTVDEGNKKVTETHQLSVTLKDANDNPITDATSEQLAALTATATAGASNATVGQWTNAGDGVYTTTISAEKPGTYTVAVKSGNNNLTAGANTSAVFVPGEVKISTDPSTAGNYTSFTVDSDDKTVGQAHTVTVTLRDEKGNAVDTSTINAGDLKLVTQALWGLTTTDFTAGDNGIFTATVTSNTPATRQLRVTYKGSNLPVTTGGTDSATWTVGAVDTTNAGTTYAITPGVAGAEANGTDTQTITITLADSQGNPITGQANKIAITEKDTTNTTIGTVKEAETTPGTYTATVTSTKAGSYKYDVTYGGSQAISATTDKDTAVFNAGAVATASLTVDNGGSAQDPITAGTQSAVTYTPKDAKDNPVNLGDTVILKVPGQPDVTLTRGDNGSYTGTVTFTAASENNGQGASTLSVDVDGTAGDATAEVHVKASTVEATKSTAELATDFASYGVSNENTTGTPNVVRVTLKDTYGNPTTLGDEETVTVTSSNPSEGFTVTVDPAQAVDGQVGVYTVDVKGQVQGDRPTGTADETIRSVDLQAKVGDTTIGSTLNAQFVSPPVNTSIEQTNFTVTKTDTSEDSVLADGADTYTVTVKLYAQDTENNRWELQPLKGRAKSLQVKDAAGNIIASSFEDKGNGVYTATIASTKAHTGAIQVTTSGDAVLPAAGQTAGTAKNSIEAVFAEATVDPRKSTFAVQPGNEVTAGDNVTLVYTPKDAHGNVIDVPEGVQVTGLGTDPIALTKQRGGSYKATVPANAVGSYTLTPVKSGTTEPALGPTAALTVNAGEFSAANSTLSFEPTAPATADNFVAGNTATLVFTPKDVNGLPTKTKILVDGVEQDTVTVTVEGNEQTLTWNADRGAYVTAQPATLTKAGEDAATVTTVDGVPNATLTVKPAAPASVDWATDAWYKAAAATDNTPLTATAGGTLAGTTGVVKDQYGNPVAAGTKVDLALPGVQGTETLTVGQGGTITIPDVTLPSTAGHGQIKVSQGNTTLSTVKVTTSAGDVSLDPNAAHSSTSSIDPGSKKADGTEHYTVTVKLVDANGNPVSGKADKLSLASTDDAAKIPGLADLTFTESSDTPGTYAVEVPSTVALTGTVQVNYTDGNTAKPVGSPLSVEFTAGDVNADPTKAKDSDGKINANNATWAEVTTGTKKADGTDAHTVTVHLRDVYGNPVTLSQGDLAKLGLTVSGDNADKLSKGEWAAVAGTPGAYSIPVTTTTAGSYTITPTYDGMSIHTGTSGANGVTVNSESTSLTATFGAADATTATVGNTGTVDQGATITTKPTVTVTDANGNPASGADVWVKVGDNDPVKVTLGDDGSVTLNGENGTPNVDQLTENTTITVYGSEPTAQNTPAPLGSGTIQVRTPAPTNVVAVKDPSNDNKVTVSGNAPAGATVTITDKDGNQLGTATVGQNGTFSTTLATDATPVTVTATAANQVASTPVPADVVTRQSKPTSVTAVKTADGSSTTVTVGLPTDATVGDKVVVRDPSDPTKQLGTHTITAADVTKGSVDVPLTGTVPATVEAVIADKDGDAHLTSQPASATVATQVATPEVSEAAVTSGGDVTVSGTVDKAPTGTKVTVTNADGKIVAEGTVGTDDKFTATQVAGAPAVKPGDQLTVTANADGAAKSEPAPTTATATPNAAAETVTAVKDPQTGKTTISGTVPATVPAGTKVVITLPDGTTATAVVKDDHSYTVDVDGLKKGDSVSVVVGEAPFASASKQATVTEQDPFAQPTGVVASQDAQGVTTVTGTSTAPEGTPVAVTDPKTGQPIGTGTVGKDGTFTVTVPTASKPQGDKVEVTVGSGDLTSKPVEVTVKPASTTEPSVPVKESAPTEVKAERDPESGNTTITGNSGAGDGTKVTVKDAAGNTVATGTVKDGKIVGTDGKPLVVPGLNSGDKVQVTVGEGDAESDAAPVTVTDGSTPAPAKEEKPTNVEAVKGDDGKTTITGSSSADDGTKVTVKDAAGSTVAEGIVKDGKIVGTDGNPLVVPGLNPGDKVQVTVGEGDAESEAAEPTVTDGSTPAPAKEAAPTGVKASRDAETGATTITGSSSAADGTKVTVKDAAGNTVAEGIVKDGKIVGSDSKPLVVPGLHAGDKLQVTVGEGATTSDAAPVTVKDQSKDAPVITNIIHNPETGTVTIIGYVPGADEGVTVTVINPDTDQVLGTGTTDAEGNFEVLVPAELADGLTNITVKASDRETVTEGAVIPPATTPADNSGSSNGNTLKCVATSASIPGKLLGAIVGVAAAIGILAWAKDNIVLPDTVGAVTRAIPGLQDLQNSLPKLPAITLPAGPQVDLSFLAPVGIGIGLLALLGASYSSCQDAQ